jgi:carbon-monoxide dehydrogenase small subunit
MLGQALLASEPDPDREHIREVVASNYCRCTGYQTIVDSIAACAAARRGCGRTPS